MKGFFSVMLVVIAACSSGGSTPVGQACTKDSDCKTSSCQSTQNCGMVCVCTSDSDCAAGSHCTPSDCGSSCGLP